jgi:hypothetical protein
MALRRGQGLESGARSWGGRTHGCWQERVTPSFGLGEKFWAGGEGNTQFSSWVQEREVCQVFKFDEGVFVADT